MTDEMRALCVVGAWDGAPAGQARSAADIAAVERLAA
jgi:hypothetical protein